MAKNFAFPPYMNRSSGAPQGGGRPDEEIKSLVKGEKPVLWSSKIDADKLPEKDEHGRRIIKEPNPIQHDPTTRVISYPEDKKAHAEALKKAEHMWVEGKIGARNRSIRQGIALGYPKDSIKEYSKKEPNSRISNKEWFDDPRPAKKKYKGMDY